MKIIVQLLSCTCGRLAESLKIYLADFGTRPMLPVLCLPKKVMDGAQCHTCTFTWSNSILSKKKKA